MHGYMIPYTAKIPGTDVTFQMVPIAGGEFWLGSPAGEAGRHDSEGPRVKFIVPPFWMGKHEVTWGEYHGYYDLNGVFKQFNRAGTRRVTKENRADIVTAPSMIYYSLGRMPEVRDKRTVPNYPAVSMTQYGAKQYTKWLSKLTGEFYRLPSEVEWEYACRAGSKTAYHFGDTARDLDKYAWHFGNANEQTHPVGGRKPNAWGLYDMHGNAAEWVLDQFDERGYKKLEKRVAARREPIRWPTELYPRTVRGGSWDSDPQACRSASRRASSIDWQELEAQIPTSPWWLASDMQSEIGFRIIRPIVPPPKKDHAKYWDTDIEALQEAIEDCVTQSARGAVGIVDPKLPDAIQRAIRK